ncbi:nitroreductase family protein [Salidesulfovibrio brasiliensis]|uniref:nitroreductase family protein n=1 Tax=Salidesulfovibrio brasiliensis TaxID=221711 RepID=UPI0006D1F7FF|nr:nitroreductase family protein [Salidesulfovibrio brasiliensis]
MEVMEAIRSRRSIRKYTDEPVSEADVKDILEAAMMAPSAGNAQPWQFVVVDDPEKLAACKDVNPYAAMAPKAPLGVLVCGDMSLEKFPGYWPQDCAAAVQNMLLAVHGKGLGAVWTGIHPIVEREEGFARLFGLPENVKPLALVVIGHPAQNPTAESRYKAERVHRNEW